jgi:hypothetical protein
MNLIERLRADIHEIRTSHPRTGPKAEDVIRWEGTESNPNGWRRLKDLANDVEELLNEHIRLGIPIRENPSDSNAGQSETVGEHQFKVLPSSDNQSSSE